MISQEGSTKIINFKTPRAGILLLGRGQISHIGEMLYFFKNLLFAQIRQIESIVIMTKEESTIFFLISCLRGRGSCAVAWSYSDHAIFLLLFLSTLGHGIFFSTPRHGSDKLSIKQ